MNTQFESVITTKTGSRVIGKETSPLLPKVKGPELNLRDRLDHALSNEKQMAMGYSTSINEAIDPELFSLLCDIREKTQSSQRKFFEALFDLGEYSADLAADPQVNHTVDVFNGYRGQLPYGKPGQPPLLH